MPLSKIDPNMQAGGPVFSAYATATLSLATNTFTKLPYSVEEFDSANCYDNATNFRFTPNVAGYYQINAAAYLAGAAYSILTIYKNGVEFKRGIQGAAVNSPLMSTVSALIYMNGSTDYLEIYGFQNSGITATVLANSAVLNYFQGALVKAA